MTEISESLDKKAETWYQDTDPSLNWNERREKEPLQDSEKETITDSKNEDLLTVWEREKVSHNGDLWHNTTTNVQYIYINGNWQEMNVPDEVLIKSTEKHRFSWQSRYRRMMLVILGLPVRKSESA